MRGLRNRIAYDFGQRALENRIRLWARLDKIWYHVTNLKSHMHLSGSRKLWKVGKSLLYIT